MEEGHIPPCEHPRKMQGSSFELGACSSLVLIGPRSVGRRRTVSLNGNCCDPSLKQQQCERRNSGASIRNPTFRPNSRSSSRIRWLSASSCFGSWSSSVAGAAGACPIPRALLRLLPLRHLTSSSAVGLSGEKSSWVVGLAGWAFSFFPLYM